MSVKTVSVIGLGYIGLPTAAMFAAYGKNVIGVDVTQSTVDIINRGEIHIVEPELDAIVCKAVKDGRLRAVLCPEPADAFLVAVPTPFLSSEDGIPLPDLAFIQSAAKSIASVLKRGDIVILESTSPVGATEQLAQWLSEARPDLTFPSTHGDDSDIRVAHCPERVLPGHVVRELVENDRVIGGLTEKCSQVATQLYKTFVKGECITTNARTAEMAKLTENASRDVSIAFANELSLICDELDIDVWELIALANRHPRVNILQPGAGVGGHCIAVDPWFIVAKSPETARMIHTARQVNDGKPIWVQDKVKAALSQYLIDNPYKSANDVTIACYGLAFKPDIDDLRESPALEITKALCDALPCQMLAVEPNISDLPQALSQPKLELCDLSNALNGADIHVLLVDHKEFKTAQISEELTVIDCKGIWH